MVEGRRIMCSPYSFMGPKDFLLSVVLQIVIGNKEKKKDSGENIK